jgi:hypothetical protein
MDEVDIVGEKIEDLLSKFTKADDFDQKVLKGSTTDEISGNKSCKM